MMSDIIAYARDVYIISLAKKRNLHRFSYDLLLHLFYQFLARDVIYTSHAYATMSVSVCLSVTEVNWCIIANLGLKFRSKFTAHFCRGEGSSQQHLALC